MMANSCLLGIVSKCPEIIGKTLYLSPRELPYEVVCQLNADGTISPGADPGESFETPIKMINKLFDPNLRRAGAKEDLFLQSGRKRSLRAYIRPRGRRARAEAAVGAQTERRCVGFKVQPWNGIAGTAQVRIECNVYRSVGCSGFVKNRQTILCIRCVKARNAVTTAIRSLRQERVLCTGVSRKKFEELIKSRKWEGERRAASIVTFVGTRLFAHKCNGRKEEASGRIRCRHCSKARQSLRCMTWRARRKPCTTEDHRLLYSKKKYLSASDKEKKEQLLRRLHEEKAKRFRAAVAKAKMALIRAQKFVPKHPENRKAVQSIVAYLDNESGRFKNPICRWVVDGVECGHIAESCLRLLAHLNNVHIGVQKNDNRPLDPLNKRYHCHWKACTRRQPFGHWKAIYAHLKDHSGTLETQRRVEILRNQMVNANLPRTSRRHVPAARDLAGANYSSRRSWELARAYSGLPMISGSTIRRMKNAGGATSGIDMELLQKMDEMVSTREYLRHGVLVCDEVYIRPSISIHSGSKNVYGLADDNRGALGHRLLVFQYLCIFSKRRFRANIAVFACAKASPASTMLDWFLKVGHALETHGFHLHGLVCDGDAKNRGLQNTLSEAEQFGAANTASDCGIIHPFSSMIPRFYLLSDPTHCVKKFRNSWCNEKRMLRIPVPLPTQDHDYASACVWQSVSWDHLRAVYDFQQTQLLQGHRLDRQLSQAHIAVENFEKMNMKTAIDVISEPIERAMEEQVPGSDGTRRFMQLVRIFWLAINQGKVFSSFENTEHLRANLSFVGQEITYWYNSSTNRATEFITLECYQDAVRVCKGVPGVIDQIFNQLDSHGLKPRFIPKLITQDYLERDFGALRQMCGGTSNPAVQSAMYGLKTLNMRLLHNFSNKCPA